MFKSKTMLHSLTAATCLSAALLASVGAVSAQQASIPPTLGNRADPHSPEGGPLAGAPGWLRGLDLTREQREKIFDLLAPARADREQQLRDRFVGAADDADGIRELIATGKLTKREAVRLATDRADQMKKQSVKDAEILGAIYEDVLTTEQRQTLQEHAKRAPQEVTGRLPHRRGAGLRTGLDAPRDSARNPRGHRDNGPERS